MQQILFVELKALVNLGMSFNWLIVVIQMCDTYISYMLKRCICKTTTTKLIYVKLAVN